MPCVVKILGLEKIPFSNMIKCIIAFKQRGAGGMSRSIAPDALRFSHLEEAAQLRVGK